MFELPVSLNYRVHVVLPLVTRRRVPDEIRRLIWERLCALQQRHLISCVSPYMNVVLISMIHRTVSSEKESLKASGGRSVALIVIGASQDVSRYTSLGTCCCFLCDATMCVSLTEVALCAWNKVLRWRKERRRFVSHGNHLLWKPSMADCVRVIQELWTIYSQVLWKAIVLVMWQQLWEKIAVCTSFSCTLDSFANNVLIGILHLLHGGIQQCCKQPC